MTRQRPTIYHGTPLTPAAALEAIMPVRSGTLADTVIRVTYPALLSNVARLDDRRARSNKEWGGMTEHYFSSNESEAELLCLHAHVCCQVLRAGIGREE